MTLFFDLCSSRCFSSTFIFYVSWNKQQRQWKFHTVNAWIISIHCNKHKFKFVLYVYVYCFFMFYLKENYVRSKYEAGRQQKYPFSSPSSCVSNKSLWCVKMLLLLFHVLSLFASCFFQCLRMSKQFYCPKNMNENSLLKFGDYNSASRILHNM